MSEVEGARLESETGEAHRVTSKQLVAAIAATITLTGCSLMWLVTRAISQAFLPVLTRSRGYLRLIVIFLGTAREEFALPPLTDLTMTESGRLAHA